MLGILMLIHHRDEAQSTRANNGAGARESGPQHPGARPRPRLQGGASGGIWEEQVEAEEQLVSQR